MRMASSLRVLALMVAGVLSVTLLAAARPDPAEAAHACRIPVTTRLDLGEKFAGNSSGRSTSKYYWATADGSTVGQFNQSANVIMNTFPVGAYPHLLYKRIGEREAIGSMAQSQTPQALAGIDADFFTFADIQGTTSIEMARGPMIADGTPIRGTYRSLRVVGLDSTMQPYGGELSLRGFVQARTGSAPKISLRSLNWHSLLTGGVNVYTPDWSNAKSTTGKVLYPRPAGAVEWVLNARNKVKAVRLAGDPKLGAPVAADTRVLAFSSDVASQVQSISVGTRVRVNIRQSTTTGVTLQMAVGRGLELIRDGKPAPLGCRAYAKTGGAVAARPRMFVGWDAKGRWRAFVVPGTKVYLKNGSILQRDGGLGLANAANIAKKLGMANAYELDGGGSTSLWTRSGTTWTRKDLYKMSVQSGCACERWMSNGLSFLTP
ncbi:MAG: phosphodiester glycosidase family protein [Actinomycetes bacterium]